MQEVLQSPSEMTLHTCCGGSFLGCGCTCFRGSRQGFLALPTLDQLLAERRRVDLYVQRLQQIEESLAVLLPTVQVHPARVEQLHHERRVVFLHFWQGDAQRRPVRVVGSRPVAWPGRGYRAPTFTAADGVQLIRYLGHCVEIC